MTDEHRMRVLMTGTDDEGRSCVVGDEWVTLGTDAASPGFWLGQLYETTAVPPPPRPEGRGVHLDTAVAPGQVQWHLVDFAPGQAYPMHHTDTIDLDIVLAGSLELHLDDGVHLLEAGDAAVVTGVDHAWVAGTRGARLSVVFIGTSVPTAVR